MAGGSTQQSIRKALGAIKDSTKVGLAKVNSDYKDLDIAVVKATNHVECPPKEKHVRTIFAATSVARPRADVAYCIHALARRIAKTHNWTVALKAMMVIHRTLREGDPTFREELIQYSRSRGHILNLSNFKDDSSPNAWDYSAWVRTYALFLEERLECFRVLKYDVESEKSSGHSKTRELDTVELLEHLPALQQLLHRLMGCQPEGAAVSNYCIQAALGLVLKESFKLYRAINDGIINLVDKFFEMQRHDAIKALDIYKKAGQQAERLSEFYEVCKSLELARSFQFPTLEQPPQSFLSTMEQYVKDAPRVSNVPKEIEYYDDRGGQGRLRIGPSPSSPPEYKDEPDYQDASPRAAPAPPPPEEAPPPPPAPPQMETDLLGLGDMLPDANQLEEQNALALAIVPQGASANGGTHDANGGVDLSSGATGWELALVTTPTTGNGTTTASDPNQKLAGGLDKLLLDSLYDDALTRRPNSYGQAPNSYNSLPAGAPNPFDTGLAPQDPFMASRGVAPPPNVQMAHMMQQQMMMQQPPHMMGAQPPNPFGTPFGAAPVAPAFPGAVPPGTPPNQMVPYGAPAPQFTNNPFGNPGYL